jgi:bifunctional DNA-binding transcriptional regulator/antitoxin component of YhaV-PrlF toxin-antitoxin module
LTEGHRLKRISPAQKGPEGWERVVTPNGDNGARVSLPLSALEALGIATGDVVTINVVGNEISVKKKVGVGPIEDRGIPPW